MCIYVKHTLNYNELKDDMIVLYLDASWIRIKPTNLQRSLVIGTVYRSGTYSRATQRDTELHRVLHNITSTYQHTDDIVIVGDFNYKLIDWNNGTCDNTSSEFMKTLEDCYLSQMIETNTRYRNTQNSSLLDLILTDNPENINNINI